MRSALFLLALLLLAFQAEAQPESQPWVRYVIKRQCYRHVDAWGAVSYPCYQRRVAVRAYRDYEPSRVYGYERRRDEDYRANDPPSDVQRVRAHCLWDSAPVQIGGEDKLEQTRAETSAQENWQREVERRSGTIYSDIRYAAQISMACIRKVPSTMIQSAQASGGLWHYVCEMTAVPCKVPPERQDEDTRAKRRSERLDDEAGRRADPKARMDYYEAPPPPKGWREKWQRWRGRE